MKCRFNANGRGELTDREGRVYDAAKVALLASICPVASVTFDVPDPEFLVALATGDYGGVLKGLEETATSKATAPAELQVKPDHSPQTDLLDEPRAVWNHYVAVMQPRSKVLQPQERRLILEALKVATAAELCKAIDGNSASAFHQGSNDRHRKYNRLSHIIRGRQGRETTRERIDYFIEIAESAARGGALASVPRARVSAAKREVRDAQEFPNDEQVVRRGARAEEWLREQGVVFDPASGRFSEVDPTAGTEGKE